MVRKFSVASEAMASALSFSINKFEVQGNPLNVIQIMVQSVGSTGLPELQLR